MKLFSKLYSDFWINYDNLEVVNSFRTVQDSVDWGFGNLVVNEPSTIEDAYGTLTVDGNLDVKNLSADIINTSKIISQVPGLWHAII